MHKIKAMLTENLLLKIAALIFAVIIWLVVVNVSNPPQSRSITSNVEVINPEVLSQQGKYYKIPDGYNTVTFRVTAPRSVIEKLSSSDFRAVADLNNLENDTRIPIEIQAINHQSSITISNRKYYLTVEVGMEMEEKFIISPQIKGKPASGFIMESANVEPNVIMIKGPENIVSKIDKVVAYCDISDVNEPITENVVPTILDSDGHKVDTTNLTLSLSTVNMSVTFTNVKDVSIELEGSSENTQVEVTGVSISPTSIRIRGNASVLNNITKIIIPRSVINLSTITEDISTTVDISQYLPEGASLAAEVSPEVSISVKVSGENSKTMVLPIANISVKNLGEGIKCEFVDEEVKVVATGLPSALNNVNMNLLTAYIDTQGLGVGEHTVKVEIDTVEGVEFGPATVKIKIVNGE